MVHGEESGPPKELFVSNHFDPHLLVAWLVTFLYEVLLKVFSCCGIPEVFVQALGPDHKI